MNHLKLNTNLQGLRQFLILWSSQALSSLGSSMTSFALIIWSYEQEGSALATALLTVCSYAPYVLLSVFAGVLSDRWSKKRTLMTCDALAAASTCAVWLLLASGRLRVWHLYLINGFNGTMNAFQQPASEVVTSLLSPREQFQKTAALKSFSNSLVTILTPAFATALFSLAGMGTVIVFDLATFLAAFLTLALVIRIPEPNGKREPEASFFASALAGIRFLRQNKGILYLILFLAAINLTAAMYEAALPAMALSRNGGSQAALGAVSTCSGLATLAGSLAAALLPAPKSRVRVITASLMVSMCTENFFLALGRSAPVWCLGAVLGWIGIPLMNANLDALMRTHIPVAMQGRVYAVRNALQFFTIPVGYLVSGFLIDWVLEPFMAGQTPGAFLLRIFGTGKGSGAALLFFLLGILGASTCLYFGRNREIWRLEEIEK